MAITIVGTPFVVGSTNGSGFTTSAVNTIGATAIVVATSAAAGDPADAISDSAGNSWGSAIINVASGGRLQVWWVANPTTSGTHTFTVNSTGFAPSIAVIALAGTPTSSIQDGSVATNTTTAQNTIQPGSITPSANNYIVLTFVSSTSTANSITAPFDVNRTDVTGTGNHEAMQLSWEIQTTATARNPTTDFGFASDAAAGSVVIKSAAAGDPDQHNPFTKILFKAAP